MDGAGLCASDGGNGNGMADEPQGGGGGCLMSNDMAAYEGEYPRSLFNKGVRTQDEEHVGHVMKETKSKIVVFGHFDYRFDVPKGKIIAAGRNVILGMDYGDIFAYKVERNAPLPADG